MEIEIESACGDVRGESESGACVERGVPSGGFGSEGIFTFMNDRILYLTT
jgi:hypothetical protein